MRVEIEFYRPPSGAAEDLGRYLDDVRSIAYALRDAEGEKRATDVIETGLRFLVDLREVLQELALADDGRGVDGMRKHLRERHTAWMEIPSWPSAFTIYRTDGAPCVVFCCVVAPGYVRIIGLAVVGAASDLEDAPCKAKIVARWRSLEL
ncbi:MAG: hypothetical protein IPM60_09920 [Rhodospirillales bacterium]|nr:hypothetical protein [Rhodospirillales bacterium]